MGQDIEPLHGYPAKWEYATAFKPINISERNPIGAFFFLTIALSLPF